MSLEKVPCKIIKRQLYPKNILNSINSIETYLWWISRAREETYQDRFSLTTLRDNYILSICFFLGFYAYIEASWPRRAGNVARLESPELNGTQCMRFQYNMFGRFMGDLQIYVQDNKSMIFLWGRYKNQGVGWHSTNVTVYGDRFKVLFDYNK